MNNKQKLRIAYKKEKRPSVETMRMERYANRKTERQKLKKRKDKVRKKKTEIQMETGWRGEERE